MPHLDALVASFACRVQILVHLVEQPEEKLLCIVLRGASKLCAIAIDNSLETGAVIALIATGPQRLEHIRQLLRKFALCAEFPRVNLVATLQIGLEKEVELVKLLQYSNSLSLTLY